jgi:hypothetical protein
MKIALITSFLIASFAVPNKALADRDNEAPQKTLSMYKEMRDSQKTIRAFLKKNKRRDLTAILTMNGLLCAGILNKVLRSQNGNIEDFDIQNADAFLQYRMCRHLNNRIVKSYSRMMSSSN